MNLRSTIRAGSRPLRYEGNHTAVSYLIQAFTQSYGEAPNRAYTSQKYKKLCPTCCSTWQPGWAIGLQHKQAKIVTLATHTSFLMHGMQATIQNFLVDLGGVGVFGFLLRREFNTKKSAESVVEQEEALGRLQVPYQH